MSPTDPTEGSGNRKELLPEENAVGSADPAAQAAVILAESQERTLHPEETRRASGQTPDGAPQRAQPVPPDRGADGSRPTR